MCLCFPLFTVSVVMNVTFQMSKCHYIVDNADDLYIEYTRQCIIYRIYSNLFTFIHVYPSFEKLFQLMFIYSHV